MQGTNNLNLRKIRIKGKKADIQLQFFLMNLLIPIIILVFLIYFVNNSLTLEGQKVKILAKEIALLMDFAKPGTEMSVNIRGFSVSFDNKNMEVIVQANNKLAKYSYSLFSLNRFVIKQEGDFLKIQCIE